jgi:sulfate adenylyltransferase subunit 2
MGERGLLKQLEAESIYILREVAAQFAKPVILYSVGKDSSVLLHLAAKAFWPMPIPFQLLHIDTGYKFPEMYEFRDRLAVARGLSLTVHRHEQAIANNANPHDLGTLACCGFLKTEALLQGLSRMECDAAIGGARRDEEKSRAKERVFSFRDKKGQWEPRSQRPELWQHFNGRINKGESIRAFPLSNWTELDIWLYILQENIEVVPLYFAAQRPMIRRGNLLLPSHPSVRMMPHEKEEIVTCRFRSLGCMPCTGAIESQAQTLEDIVLEMASVTQSERALRVIDHDTEGSMEIKKREGYF